MTREEYDARALDLKRRYEGEKQQLREQYEAEKASGE